MLLGDGLGSSPIYGGGTENKRMSVVNIAFTSHL